MLKTLAVLGLLTSQALADEYLIQPDAATAVARSQAQCVTNGCDGRLTKYWWSVVQDPTSSTTAIVVQPDGAVYDGKGLSAPEKASADATKTLPAKWFTPSALGGQSVLTPVDPAKAAIGGP